MPPRLLVLAAALAVWPVLSLASAPAADAHPFGPPQTAEVSADGDRVVVQWRFGATDDISYLAAALGALPPERVLLDGVVLYKDGDDERLRTDAAFDDYLLQHVTATRAGEPCTGEVAGTDDLVDQGVRLGFACAAGSGAVDVTIDLLTDLHPAYRTLATGPGGQRAVYAADDPRHAWDLDLAAAGGDDLRTSAVLQLGGVLGGLAVLVALVAAGLARHRRRA